MNKDNNNFIGKNKEIIKDNYNKFNLTIDFIMIIGKYLENNQDFINLIKVCKKFQDLLSLYYFNPISDPSLFINIQTQHFYKENDIDNKIKNLYQYIYWYKKTAYNLEIFNSKKNNKIYKNIELEGDCEFCFDDYFFQQNRFYKNDYYVDDINEVDFLPIPLYQIDCVGLEHDKKIIIPDGVVKMDCFCFYDDDLPLNKEVEKDRKPRILEEIILPNTLKELGIYCFINSNITSIIIPEGVIKININCFYNCIKLINVKLPDSLKEICANAFRKTGIIEIKIPKNVIILNNYAFNKSINLKRIILPKRFKDIEFLTNPYYEKNDNKNINFVNFNEVEKIYY